MKNCLEMVSPAGQGCREPACELSSTHAPIPDSAAALDESESLPVPFEQLPLQACTERAVLLITT